MAKNSNNDVQKRDVLAELLGTVPSKNKAKLGNILAEAGKKAKIGPKPGKETKGFKSAIAKVAAAKVAAAKPRKDAKPGKDAKVKTSAPAVRREPVSAYKPEQRIHVVRERECRAGTKAEQCWILVRKSKTIGDYLTARKKNDMGDGIGGWFGNFVKNGYISIR